MMNEKVLIKSNWLICTTYSAVGFFYGIYSKIYIPSSYSYIHVIKYHCKHRWGHRGVHHKSKSKLYFGCFYIFYWLLHDHAIINIYRPSSLCARREEVQPYQTKFYQFLVTELARWCSELYIYKCLQGWRKHFESDQAIKITGGLWGSHPKKKKKKKKKKLAGTFWWYFKGNQWTSTTMNSIANSLDRYLALFLTWLCSSCWQDVYIWAGLNSLGMDSDMPYQG